MAAAHLTADLGGLRAQRHPYQAEGDGDRVFSLGDFADGDDRQEIVLRDASAGIYKRLVLKDNRIIGTVLFGETADGAWFNRPEEAPGRHHRDARHLISARHYQEGAPLDPMAAVAALPDDAEICGCNGVCKGKITGLIEEKGLSTLDDVRAHTKASASCGSCTGLVEQLMTLTLGDAYNPNAVQPICACTSLGHDDVRRLIKAKGLKTIYAVMQELEWKTSCGCAKCRPALNYYLVCDWPGEYADDYQSRFINERAHANIQKDGTYSVVPRMWGGVTSAKELRAIADVVDKFAIPTVKVTGGQRIDMLGVKKEDLPAVWADLGKAGFVSGHAYAKGLRTVKTCVGTDWCRFGTQDSTGLGIRIEKFMWGSWTPAKVKMAVSGCPRNCAEATCKDVGVVCVEFGFEIHFAGAAGLDIKGTEVLGLVQDRGRGARSHRRAGSDVPRAGALLERIYKWIKRVGVAEIRRQVLEDRERRKAFFDRFVYSQKFAQVDPWSERASGKRQARVPAAGSGGLGAGGGVKDELDRHRLPLRHSRAAARVASSRHRGMSPSSAPPRIASSPSRIAAPTRVARSARASCTARGDLPAAQLGHLARNRRGARRRPGVRAHDPGQVRRQQAPHRADSAGDRRPDPWIWPRRGASRRPALTAG